ncbi:MAG: ParA family protein, partial [Methylococcales bacterium]|nr:ParA family protein [Methylococcales bacterium]
FTAEETIKNVLLDDPLLIKDVIRETHWPTVDLIPAHEEMEDTDYSLPDPKKSNTKKLGPAVYRLKLALEFVKQDYDIILCDCGPNQGPMTLNALLASDHLLLPILPDLNTFTSSMTYLNRMKSLFTDVEENIQSINFFINNHNGNKQAVAAEAFLREQFDGIILDSTIPTSEGFITAGNNLSSVYELRGKNKNTAVKNSMNYTKKLCDEIMTYVQHGWENQ